MRKCFIASILAALLIGCCLQPIFAAKPAPPGAKNAQIVNGVVRDKNGKPLPQAKVCYIVFKAQSDSFQRRPELEKAMPVPVVKDGRFSFKSTGKPKYGVHVFQARCRGYSYGMGWKTEKDRSDVRITLLPEYTLKGRVVDESGKPVVGATVKLNNCSGGFGKGGWSASIFPVDNTLTGVSAKNGTFNIPHLFGPDGFDYYNLDLVVTAKGWATINKTFRDRDFSDNLQVVLPKECMLTGSLSLPGNSASAPKGTRLMLKVDDKWGWDPRVCAVDAKGNFEMRALPPGKSTLFLAPPNPKRGADGKYAEPQPLPWVLASTAFELELGKSQTLHLALSEGAIVKGVVKEKNTGKPAAGAQMRLSPGGRSDYYSSITAVTDAEGKFSTRVAAGNVSLTVESYGRGRWYGGTPAASFTIKDGEEKSDLVIEIDPNAKRNDEPSYYSVTTKPIPVDFSLKPGTFNLKWDPDFNCYYSVNMYARPDDPAKPIIRSAPKLASDNAKRYLIPFDGSGDDGKLAIILDESQGTGKGFDTAYIDGNRNFDLTDDSPVKFNLPKGNQAFVEWVKVQSRQGHLVEGHTNNPAQVRLNLYDIPRLNDYDTPYLQVSCQRKGAWKGWVDSSKGRVECAIVDTNSNGLYNDTSVINDDQQLQSRGDIVFVNTNGFGRVVALDSGPHAMIMQSISRLGNKFYNIKVNELGNQITVKSYDGPMANLLIKAGNIKGMQGSADSATVTCSLGAYGFKGLSGKSVQLPASIYRVNSCQLKLKADKSRDFDIDCVSNTKIDAKSNKTTTIDISGPLTMAISPDVKEMSWTAGKSEWLRWSINIGNSAILSSIGDQSGRYERYAPKVKFFTDKGKQLATKTAGYT